MLKIDYKLNQLVENANKVNIKDFVVWELDTLHNRLLEKHNETFWIAADSIFEDGKEYFRYKKVEHTKKPILSQFDLLIEQGVISRPSKSLGSLPVLYFGQKGVIIDTRYLKKL